MSPYLPVALVVAMEADRGIGYKGGLPWERIKEDMQRFRLITKGGIVIMGRKTYDSIPEQLRPLPDRVNIVITRNVQGFFVESDGTIFVDSPWRAMLVARSFGKPIFVIGGSEIYKELYDECTEAYVTHIREDFPADATFNVWNPYEWDAKASHLVKEDPDLGCEIEYVHYVRAAIDSGRRRDIKGRFLPSPEKDLEELRDESADSSED